MSLLKQFALMAASALLSAHAFAQSDIQVPQTGSAYLQDGRGLVVRNGSGLCWRSGFWTPADALPGCDGELVPPVVRPTAPTIVQAPQEPATPPAVLPPPAAARCDFSVVLGNEEAFGFDRATLSPAARKRIEQDVIARLPECAKIDKILVTGHSDRIGAAPYNQKLSERRAAAVGAYLRERGIAEEILGIQGAGATEPVQACDANLPSRQLIRCLAPNRRVRIDVTGTAR